VGFVLIVSTIKKTNVKMATKARVKFAHLLPPNNVDKELLLELVLFPLEFCTKTIDYYFR